MKNFYRILSLIFVILASALVMIACGDSTTDSGVKKKCDADKHSYSPWQVYIEATCTTKGKQRRECLVCRLDIQERVYSDSDNHNFVDYKCTRCGFSNAPKKVGFQLSDDETYYILYSVEDKETKEYSIPAEYEGKPVKEIASKAFEGCTKLKTLIVPSSVLKIGEGAFTGCYSLTNITLPFIGASVYSSTTTFGYIFGTAPYSNSVGIVQKPGNEEVTYYVPTGLTDVVITGGKIGNGVFQNCTKLKRIEITSDATVIGDYAFSDCRSMTTVKLPDSITKIGNYAFQYCDVMDVLPIKEGIEEIGDYVFAGCLTAPFIELPQSLDDLGEGAFLNCASIKNATISKNVRNIPNNLFQGCTGLEVLILDEGVRSVGRFAFSKCTSLREIQFSSTVTDIEKGAFEECSALTDLTIPSSIENVDEYSFQKCTGLKNLVFSEGVVTIGDYSFSFCKSLEKVYLSSTVKEFEITSFASCDSLTTFEINENNEYFATIDGNIFTYDKKSFILYSPGNKAQSFEIPEGVTDVKQKAFEYAPFLEEIVFPSTMKHIPSKIFNSHPTLKSIVVREGVESIGPNAFENCKNLRTVTIYGIKNISDYAFNQCPKHLYTYKRVQYSLTYSRLSSPSPLTLEAGMLRTGV